MLKYQLNILVKERNNPLHWNAIIALPNSSGITFNPRSVIATTLRRAIHNDHQKSINLASKNMLEVSGYQFNS